MAIDITKPTVGADTDTWGGILNTALDELATAIPDSEKGAASGVAVLDADGQVLDGNGDPVSADWSTLTGKPAVIAAGADQAAARSVIGAGTSSFDGAYGSLSGKPTLGTAAAAATTDFDASGLAGAAQTAAEAYTDTAIGGLDFAPKSEPWQFRVEDYGALGDGKMAADAAMTSGSPTLTCATSAPFAAGDVGKAILVNGAGPSVGGANGALSTTIASYVSPTVVTLAGNATATVSGAYASYGTDDTTAINAAVTAATAYGVAHNYYAEILFKPHMYMIGGPLIQGGATKGNAQIPMPLIPINGNPTLILALIGTRNSAGASMFTAQDASDKPAPGNEGTVLKSTMVGQSYSGTFGGPSVIGTPTYEQGYTGGFTAAWDNLTVVVDGVSITVPVYPTVTAFDFRSCVKLEVPWARALADSNETSLHLWDPRDAGGTGLATPRFGNNAHTFIGSFAACGFTTGMLAYEHTSFQEFLAIFCDTGLWAIDSGHSISGLTYIAEGNTNHLKVSGGSISVNIVAMQCETASMFRSGYYVYDDGDQGHGRLGVSTSQSVDQINVNGAANFEIILGNPQGRGHVTAPSMPATTVAFTNPFWRHAAVSLIGGTVTDVKVDGVTVASGSNCTVIVPSGKTITLTYTVAPTWVWTLL